MNDELDVMRRLLADAARYRWLRDHPHFIVQYRQIGSEDGTREWLMCHEGYAFGSWWPTHEQAVDYAMRQLKDDCGSEVLEANADVQTLRSALTEIRDRIKGHFMYAALTPEEEIEVGGDTAELSYLARIADEALGE